MEKKKLDKRFIIPTIILAIIVCIVLILVLMPKKDNSKVVDLSDTTVLEFRDIEKSVSGTGVVESADSTLVYSTLSYLVTSVDIKLGDYVEKGQLLATLDDRYILDQITSQEINLGNTQNALQQQVNAAQTNYDNFNYALKNGLNTSLNSAQMQLDSALEGYDKAVDARENYKAQNAQIVNAKTALNDAKAKLNTAKTNYENADEQNKDALKEELDKAQENYNKAKKEYDDITSKDEVLKELDNAVTAALKGYNSAKTTYDSVKNSVYDQLDAYKTALENAKESANTDAVEESIRQLKVTLSDTKIKAPVSGTVTAVYAKEGASGSGLLFVIEDVDNLIINTNIKGYDLGEVKEGLLVSISCEAIKNAKIDGVLTSVAPTANKTQFGTTDTTSEALFKAEVEVTTKNSGLKIGMEADLDYIVESQKGVFAVPYDAIYEKDGKSYVICAKEIKDEKYRLYEIEVLVGLDDDLDVVISSSELQEGMRILNSSDNYRDLIGQELKSGTIEASPFPFPMG